MSLLSPIPDGVAAAVPTRTPIGAILRDLGAVGEAELARAAALQPLDGRPIGQILTERGWAGPDAVAAALALQKGVDRADLARSPPDLALIDQVGAARCLRLGVVPWQRAGAVTVVAAPSPGVFRAARPQLEAALGPVRYAIATKAECTGALVHLRQRSLAHAAERRVPDEESCRSLAAARVRPVLASALVAMLAALAVYPAATLAVLLVAATLALACTTLLRCAAAIATATARRPPTFRHHDPRPPADWPRISLLVPLFKEREIAGTLVRRLSRLDYPEGRLEVCLILERDDTLTRDTLRRTDLPAHFRRIVVPCGTLRTKPRAMNYALDQCHGDIVGIYDAEDAPAPDQLRRVAARFRDAQPEVASIQGILDYYNPATNWLSRCFTIDYAIWFRVILPGLARLGLPIPLGGTTVFFRRKALEQVGAWDAHNVTEDADLGIRLARKGYRTELIATVTGEEANCRPWPWIRQRSRWLKGYALTWASHSRDPRAALRDLGSWRFAGFQVLFLGALAQFVLAPVVWSLWILLAGLPHPAASVLPDGAIAAIVGVFVAAEALQLAIGAYAVNAPNRRWLIPWVPTLHLYFPLAAVAAWKALGELVTRPFFWDKTTHGQHPRETAQSGTSRSASLRNRLSKAAEM